MKGVEIMFGYHKARYKKDIVFDIIKWLIIIILVVVEVTYYLSLT